MKILVGTENKRKIEAVEKVVNVMKIHNDHTVVGCAVESQVSDTPLGSKTKDGAINRARNAQAYDSSYEMYIGIESGLVERYGEFFEEVWVAVLYKDVIYTSYSSGIKLPKIVSEKLSSDVKNHIEIMQDLREKNDIDSQHPLGVDTWGNYTGNKIAREVGIEEAPRNSLVQIFPGEKSFYGHS